MNEEWNQKATAERQIPKFIPKGKQIRIFPDKAPEEVEVDGKYGKRKLFIVDSSIGLVYLTPVQFIEVTARLRTNDFKSPVDYP